MIDAREPRDHDADDELTIRLLRLAGERPPAPDIRASRVRAAVRTEWHGAIRRRAVRRGVLLGSAFVAAAALLLLVGGVNLLEPPAAPAGAAVAVVEELEGTPRRGSGSPSEPAVARLSRHDTVRANEWIETDPRARVALRFADGTSVRLDVGSRARALSSNVLELAAGAVYVDTGRESGRFEIRTAMGTARDVGTQFELRLLDRAVRLRVRSGAVELHDRERSVSARAGTEIMMSAASAVSSPIAPHGPEWDWMGRVARPLEFDSTSLADFLERVTREQGWVVHYADPALAREASSITLHGSVDGLTPIEAVDVAITSSGLRHDLQGGELVVRREADSR